MEFKAGNGQQGNLDAIEPNARKELVQGCLLNIETPSQKYFKPLCHKHVLYIHTNTFV